MSDSSESAFSFLTSWKFGLAVCVPCFAVGLGATYYYYSKKSDNGLENKNAGKTVGREQKSLETKSNGINQNAVKDPKKVQLNEPPVTNLNIY